MSMRQALSENRFVNISAVAKPLIFIDYKGLTASNVSQRSAAAMLFARDLTVKSKLLSYLNDR